MTFYLKSKLNKMILAVVICLLGTFLGGGISHAAFKYTPLEAEIHFDCQAVEGLDDASYVINIKPKSSDMPLPDKDTLIVDASEEGVFIVTITEPGTYEYQLYQVMGNKDKVQYDDSRYNVQLFVTTDDNGDLIYSVVASLADSDEKPSEIVFANEYTAEEKTTETTTEEAQDDPAPKETEVKKGEMSDKAKSDSAKTGDTIPISVALLLIMVSITGILSVIYIKAKEKKQKERG